jgi:imidazolonepropionase-like amidohydrolase
MLAGDTGSLELHKRADVVIVNGNPLSAIEDLRNVDAIVIDGHVHRPPLLRSVGFRP